MSNTCEPTPYTGKSDIYTKKPTPYTGKSDIYTKPSFCPVLLQENSYPILQEDGSQILL